MAVVCTSCRLASLMYYGVEIWIKSADRSYQENLSCKHCKEENLTPKQRFGIINVKEFRFWFMEGLYMKDDYKESLITLIKDIEDKNFLIFLFNLVMSFKKKTGA